MLEKGDNGGWIWLGGEKRVNMAGDVKIFIWSYMALKMKVPKKSRWAMALDVKAP